MSAPLWILTGWPWDSGNAQTQLPSLPFLSSVSCRQTQRPWVKAARPKYGMGFSGLVQTIMSGHMAEHVLLSEWYTLITAAAQSGALMTVSMAADCSSECFPALHPLSTACAAPPCRRHVPQPHGRSMQLAINMTDSILPKNHAASQGTQGYRCQAAHLHQCRKVCRAWCSNRYMVQ